MTLDSAQPLLQWIAAHPTWAGIAVFLISLSESLAIVGLVVPGVVMMTAIGAMMGSGILPFWETLLWAILGAIAGDGISYWLGYHFHEHLREFWPFKQFPQLLARGEKFFKNHGGKSIIFGRFVGPVRPMIPVIAGMMDMTPRRFLFFNIISAIAWAPIYSLPGILIGVSLGTLSPEVARRVGLLILLLLLVLWIIYVFLLKLGMWLGKIISRSINKLWLKVQAAKHLSWLHRILASAQGSEEGQLGILILFLLSLFAFILITFNVIHFEGIALVNEPVYQLFRGLYEKRIIDWVALFTGLGDTILLLVTSYIIGIFLLWRKRYAAAFCWVLTVSIGIGLGYFFRQWVGMSRPDGLVFLSTQYGYPSGHALAATLFYGLAAAFIHPTLEAKYRYIPWFISITLILLIAFSRVYLGVHWFTDILGSITLGMSCVSLAIFLYRRFENRMPLARSILIPGLVSIIVGMSIYYFHTYPEKRAELVRQWPVREFNTALWWKNEAEMDSIHRSGALKRIATIFNVQWLGSITEIQELLTKRGFKLAPKFSINANLNFLVENPDPDKIPVLPKFHRDRLPIAVFTLSDPAKEKIRLVLQLWRSDFINEDGTTLWVGTLREEEATHPLPLTSLFQERAVDNELLKQLMDRLKGAPKTTYQVIPAKDSDTEILLIKTGSFPDLGSQKKKVSSLSE